MTRAIIAIVRANSVQLFFSSSWIMSHLGIKPVSGGRPPVDNKMIDIDGRSIGILFHVRDKELIEVVE